MAKIDRDSVVPSDFKGLTAEQFGLPQKLRLEGVRAKYEYKDGVKTDNLQGYVYTLTKVGGTKNRRTFDCLIPGKPLIDNKELGDIDEEVFVKVEGWTGYFYTQYNSDFSVNYVFKCEAKKITFVEDDKLDLFTDTK